MAAEPSTPSRRRRLPATAGTIGLVAIAVIVTLFAVLNVDSVKVNWIIGSGHAPLIVVIAVCLLVGAGGTVLAEHLSARRRKH